MAYKLGGSGMTYDQVRARLYYNKTSETATSVTYSFIVYVYGYSGPYSTSGALSSSLSCSGQTTYTTSAGSCSVSEGTQNALNPTSGSRSYTFTKTTSKQTKTINFSITSTGSTISGTSSGSLSLTIPAKDHYTVTYSANGGSGAPSAGTKWYNTAYTISSTKPTRTGYTFAGWKCSADSKTYSAGASISKSINKAITLTAQWTAKTVTISYNANGGSGSIASQTKTYNKTLTLSGGTGFTKQNHSITGWNTKDDGSGTAYSLSQELGATFLTALVLYAQWHLDYIQPYIEYFGAFRSDSSGNADDVGEYIHVSFDWIGGTTDAGASYRAPHIKIEIDGSIVYDADRASSTGSFSATYYGSNGYSVNSSHTVVVSVYDIDTSTYPGTATASANIPSATFPIDILADGSAMGIMTPAVAGQTLKLFVDAIYPVGSYYETSDITFDPNTYFGGRWSLEAEGIFHVSAGTSADYLIGATGGEDKHQLIESELPKVTGSFRIRKYETSASNPGSVATNVSGVFSSEDGSATAAAMRVSSATNTGNTQVNLSFGNNDVHENRPPYIAVNRWHRTA